MFATLHAGIGVEQTHSYARSLINAETAVERVETEPNRYEWQPLRKR